MTQNDTLFTQSGAPAKHPTKLGNMNALKHGLHTREAQKRWKDMENAIREVRSTLRKLAVVNPELRITFNEEGDDELPTSKDTQ